jgi:hypothetical protein
VRVTAYHRIVTTALRCALELDVRQTAAGV